MAFHVSIWPNYVLSWGVHKVNLSRSEGVILSRLYRNPASIEELTECVYGDREDGGPPWGDNCIRAAISHLRKKMYRSPIGISYAQRGRYRIIEPAVETIDRISDTILGEGKTEPED